MRQIGRWVGAGLGPVLWGVAAGVATPRGPLTPGAALASIGVSLATGYAAGWAVRSRWAMLGAPALFAISFELVRAGVVASGPTVDAPHASVFGVLALLAGRGVHGLLALLPMFAGAAYGAGLARRQAGTLGGRLRRYLGRVVTGLLAAGLALLAIAVVLPAHTEPIPGARSVAELTTVPAGRHSLGLMIRGADTTKPVLLFVPGAPGAAERGAVRAHLSRVLERHFVVATLDRRGGGSSYPAIEPTATLSLDDEIANVLATANYLRERFHADRIYLLAHSGGTIPSVLAVQRRPDLFHAYVGVGQAVDTAAADRAQYAATLDWARRHRDTRLAAELTDRGAPPYARLYDYEPMLLAEPRVFPESGAAGQGGLDESMAAEEYAFLDKVHLISGFLDTFDGYYPRTQDVDLRKRVRRLAVPAYFVDGASEVPSRTSLMREWFDLLDALRKEHVVLAGGGHRSMYERPAEFGEILTGRVLRELACCSDG